MRCATATAVVLAVCAATTPASSQPDSRGSRQNTTRVFSPAAAPSSEDQTLLAACGPGDRQLNAAASTIAERASHGQRAPSAVDLGELLREQGEPHVKARAWTYTAPRVDRTTALARMHAWLGTLHLQGSRRCGIASRMEPGRGESLAVVVVDVLADLRQDVPARVRPGSWVTVDAVAMEPATDAKVVVLGPRGTPRTVPTSFDAATGQIVGRFRADRSGAWLVQVLATIDVGPMPVLEARVAAGDDGVSGSDGIRAPGEALAAGAQDDASALHAMLNAARAAERLGALTRDSALDRVAAAHVSEMIAAGVIGHDVGDGTPPARVREAGVDAREAGENVAKAPSAALAHRALWWSPSHRDNMLHERYTRVGIATRRDTHGLLWVTEVFAD